MIKLGKLTDYAVVLMVQLAKDGQDVSRSANTLAEKTGVPEPTVAKVLKLLAREKLIESARGAAGGYKIARAANDISVNEIVTAMEGPVAITACVDGNAGDCKSEMRCPVKGYWDPVNKAIRTALENVKLSDMGVTSPRAPRVVVNLMPQGDKNAGCG